MITHRPRTSPAPGPCSSRLYLAGLWRESTQVSQASELTDHAPHSASRGKPKSVGGLLSGLRAARKWGRVKRQQGAANEAPLTPLLPPQLAAAEQAHYRHTTVTLPLHCRRVDWPRRSRHTLRFHPANAITSRPPLRCSTPPSALAKSSHHTITRIGMNAKPEATTLIPTTTTARHPHPSRRCVTSSRGRSWTSRFTPPVSSSSSPFCSCSHSLRALPRTASPQTSPHSPRSPFSASRPPSSLAATSCPTHRRAFLNGLIRLPPGARLTTTQTPQPLFRQHWSPGAPLTLSRAPRPTLIAQVITL